MKFKYIFSIIMLLFVGVGNLAAQTSLSGTVSDKETGAKLAHAFVEIPDLKLAAGTDANGNYKFENLHKGTYLIEVRLLGYAEKTMAVKVDANTVADFTLSVSMKEQNEVSVTGTSMARDRSQNPQPTTFVSNEYLNEHSATNVIDAIADIPGVSAMTDGQSISKPVIRGLGYNRVLTINDGVEQMDQAWFDEFGIEVDPDAVDRVEILKGPASLAYGSDAISGVINLMPEETLPEGVNKGDVLMNYQTNNGLINNMVHLAGTDKGISWSARVDNIMAHAYKDPADGYVVNSQFNNFNMDGTIGLHRKWGYTQLHGSYFDMATGIVDGTRDSATGAMERQVAYPAMNGGAPTYVIPTNQEATSYTPFVINQRIRHTKVVWDNSIAVGEGRITGIFSYQKNQRQETNDPTQPNTPDIYYSADAVTYDVRYVSPQKNDFDFSIGTNGGAQFSKSLGTVMLIPNYNFIQTGAFAIANKKWGNFNLSGGIRFDNRSFTGKEQWIDTSANVPQAPVAPNTPGSFEEFSPISQNYSGLSASLGGAYAFKNGVYLKLNVARGYRAPNVSEAAADGVHDGTVVYEVGTPTLKAEQSLEEDFTFGYKTKDVGFEVNVFNNSITDFIYSKAETDSNGNIITSNLLSVGGSLFPDAPVYKYTQGAAQLYGGEVVLNLHPSALPWVELHSDLSMVDGGLLNQPDSVKVLPFVPPMRINADIKFKVKHIGKSVKNGYFRFGMLNASQQTKIYEQYAIYNGLNTAQTPNEYYASTHATAGYTLFNMGLGGDLQANGHTFCKLYITCNNLFNTVYMDYMSRFKYYPYNNLNGKVGVFDMGRNVSIKVIVPFDFSKHQ